METKRKLNFLGYVVVVITTLIITLFALCLINSVNTSKLIKKINYETERVRFIERQNDKLWQFVGSLDELETINEVLTYRDSLYDSISEF